MDLPSILQDIFYVLVAAQLCMGLWSVWTGIQWLAMARRSMATHPGFFAPRAALICPCKNLEPGLEQNLTALCSQDYPNYEVFFALARADDPAYEIVRRVTQKSSVPAHIVIAGRPENCSEKVSNLRAVVEQLDPAFNVYAFADSDGRPGRQWLAHLVAPLSDDRIGAATSFRWWIPDRGGFWTALGASWDASIVTLLGNHERNFCWGGATAIRRDVFESTGVRMRWMRALSDDWTLTNALRANGRHIKFVPECLVPSVHDVSAHELLEFTNRQMIITRVYSPKTWTGGALAHLLYCTTLLFGIALVASNLAFGLPVIPLLVPLFLVVLLSAAKGVLRWIAVSELLPNWKTPLTNYAWAWTILAPLTPFLYALNFAVSASTRHIVWRGIRYHLVSETQTRIL